jgi:hypothetical protein
MFHQRYHVTMLAVISNVRKLATALPVERLALGRFKKDHQ